MLLKVLMTEIDLETHQFTYGLLARGVAFVFFFQFCTLYHQLPILHALSPIQPSLSEFYSESKKHTISLFNNQYENFYFVRLAAQFYFCIDRFRRFPSFCWVSKSVRFCKFVLLTGIICSFLLFCGIDPVGYGTSFLFFYCWIIWLHCMSSFPIFCSFPW